MISDLFQRAVELLDIVEVARWLGLQPDRNGKLCCPFHNEKTASFYINRERKIYKCFGCGEGGDAIKLTSKLKEISPMDALKLLNEVFNLGLEINKPRPAYMRKTAAERRREQERNELRAYQLWLDSTQKKLCAIYRAMTRWQTECNVEDARFLLSVRYRTTIGAMLDDLSARDYYKITKSKTFSDLDITVTAAKLREEINDKSSRVRTTGIN